MISRDAPEDAQVRRRCLLRTDPSNKPPRGCFLLQRAESKDYIDIAALTPHDSDLAYGLSGAMALYGSTFQPTEALKALVFFEDGDLESLPQAVRVHLQTAVIRVGHLPAAPAVVPLLAPQLT
jgi:hypothetical protein